MRIIDKTWSFRGEYKRTFAWAIGISGTHDRVQRNIRSKIFLMIFRDYVTRVLPNFTLRLRVTPKLREHALGVCERVISQEHENAIRHSLWLAHDRDIAYAIAIAKIDRSRLESCSQNLLVTRTVIPGVQTPKMGIRSGHRRIPDMRKNDVKSKILDYWVMGAHRQSINRLRVDSRTNRVPF